MKRDPRDVGQMSWAFVLEPVDETSARLKVFWHPLDFGMQRRQPLSLKRLVETA